ncbi:MAG: DNA polymerase III subunit gamma/tau [Opitutae bacterium]|nr:DNA polymerase III subunit gamma/tau [Opitutae bacterium]
MELKSILTEPLRSAKAVEVLERSLQKGRLAHAVLLQGENEELLEEVAHSLAAVLLDLSLGEGKEDRFGQVTSHPDFFTLRPSQKARAIRAEDTRELIRQIQHSPLLSHRKVAVVYEADRLCASSQSSSANIFLKTLEEPPLDTTIILFSTRPYVLLETIRSRCFNFRIPSSFRATEDASWQQWLADYSDLLLGLLQGIRDKERIAGSFMAAYGLVARFNGILGNLVAEAWEREKAKLPQDLKDDERDAMREGSAKGIRHRLFKELENQTRSAAAPYLADGKGGPVASKFTERIRLLEAVAGRLEVNLKTETALEDYLLSCLRIWSR